MINRAIIIASGSSVRQGQWNIPATDLPLWDIIKDEFTIGINWSYWYFKSTILMYADYQWYATQKKWVDDVPLVIGKDVSRYGKERGLELGNNIILTKKFCFQLTTMAAIQLAVMLKCPEIYVLGFDAGGIDGHTHFYDDTFDGKFKYNGHEYCGVGKRKDGLYRVDNYNNTKELNENFMQPFQQLPDGIKVFNVSPLSKVDTFPKISYEEFFNRIANSPNAVDQNKAREEVKHLMR